MTSTYDPSVPLEHDCSALLNCPPLTPNSNPSLCSLISSSSTSSSPAYSLSSYTTPPRSLYPSHRIPLGKPTTALTIYNQQHLYITTSNSSLLKMHQSYSQPSSPRRNSEQFYRPPSRSEHLLRDTLRKDQHSRQSSPSRSRLTRRDPSACGEDDGYFASIGDSSKYTSGKCNCEEANRPSSRPRPSPANVVSLVDSDCRASEQRNGTTRPVAVRRPTSSSRKSIPAGEDVSSDGRNLHSRPRGQTRYLYGSPSSPSPLPPSFARSRTVPSMPTMIRSSSPSSTPVSSSANSPTHSPNLNSGIDLTSSSSQSSGGAQEPEEYHASTFNTNPKLKIAANLPAAGKLRVSTGIRLLLTIFLR